MAWQDDLEAARDRHRSDPTARFAQLATTDEARRPRCRTVVVRRFDPKTARLHVVTDARSAKVAQLERSPWAELCWYFPKTREQFRLLARGTVLRGDITHELWEGLSGDSRRSFLWPAPGQSRAPEANFDVADPGAVPPSFVGLLFEVEEVDYLVLDGPPHHRCSYTREGGTWHAKPVNP